MRYRSLVVFEDLMYRSQHANNMKATAGTAFSNFQNGGRLTLFHGLASGTPFFGAGNSVGTRSGRSGFKPCLPGNMDAALMCVSDIS